MNMGSNSGSSTLTVYDGDFDNTHYGGGTTGYLYFCGGQAGIPAYPTLYKIPITGTGFGAKVNIENLTSGTASCSPATEFYNAGSGVTPLTTLSSTLTATGNNGQLAANITAAATTLTYYALGASPAVGDTILIDSEYMIVLTVAPGFPGTMTVTRGALSSTPAPHTGGLFPPPTPATIIDYTFGISATATTLNVADCTGILVGDYIQVGSEIMNVTTMPQAL